MEKSLEHMLISKKLQNLQGCITVHPVIRTVEASADLQFPRKRDHK